MKIDDLIIEAPMGIGQRVLQKAISKVPGGIGAKAQGKLDTGSVANSWRKKYMTYLGRTGGTPSTETISAFLKTLGLEDDIIQNTVKESVILERELTRSEVDQIFLNVARNAAAGGNLPSVSSQPGLISKAASALKKGFSKTVTPSPTKVEPAAPSIPAAPKALPVSAKTKFDPKNVKSGLGSVGEYIRSWASDINAATSKQEKLALAREMLNFLADRAGTPEAAKGAAMVNAFLKKSGDPALVNMSKKMRSISKTEPVAARSSRPVVTKSTPSVTPTVMPAEKPASYSKKSTWRSPSSISRAAGALKKGLSKTVAETVTYSRTNYIVADAILKECGLSWKDMGMRILVNESTATHIKIAFR